MFLAFMPRHITVLLLVGTVFTVSLWAAIQKTSVPPVASNLELELLQQVPLLGYDIVADYPHDALAFTQGLDYANGFIYESTGQRGHSSLRQVDLKTAVTKQQRKLPQHIFAEGLALKGGSLVQLSWRAGVAMIYAADSFTELGSWRYSGEGWGLDFNGEQFLMSDGSDVLVFRSADNFKIQRYLPVRIGAEPLTRLNELEWVHGKIFANVWLSSNIVMINANTGQVEGRIDLQPLFDHLGELNSPDAVANGIAYDADRDWFFVTGKLWPRLFALRLHHRP